VDGEGSVPTNLARRRKFSMILLWLLLSCAVSPWLASAPVSALAAEAKPGWQTEWERTLRAAEKEGEVTVAIYDQGPVTAAVVDAKRGRSVAEVFRNYIDVVGGLGESSSICRREVCKL